MRNHFQYEDSGLRRSMSIYLLLKYFNFDCFKPLESFIAQSHYTAVQYCKKRYGNIDDLELIHIGDCSNFLANNNLFNSDIVFYSKYN